MSIKLWVELHHRNSTVCGARACLKRHRGDGPVSRLDSIDHRRPAPSPRGGSRPHPTTSMSGSSVRADICSPTPFSGPDSELRSRPAHPRSGVRPSRCRQPVALVDAFLTACMSSALAVARAQWVSPCQPPDPCTVSASAIACTSAARWAHHR